jgi:hypothetical protein
MPRTELIELARLCAKQARLTTAKDVATVLWRIAQEYQEKAAKLDRRNLPDLGPPPEVLTPAA